jgi:UDPglucose 6-dehydrogenase
VNARAARRLAALVDRHLAGRAGRVAILGLSYKPHTHLVEESPSIALARCVLAGGHALAVHDPKALAAAREALGGSASYDEDPYAAVTGADAIAVMTDWPQYRELDWARIASLAAPGALVVDAWRVARGRVGGGLAYHPVGVGA